MKDLLGLIDSGQMQPIGRYWNYSAVVKIDKARRVVAKIEESTNQ